MLSDTANSRLGSLLINKRLITPCQLSLALNLQVSTGMRLGEVLVHQGILTQKQIDQALARQSRLRLWASILTLVLGPLSFNALAGHSLNTPKTEKPPIVLSQKPSSTSLSFTSNRSTQQKE